MANGKGVSSPEELFHKAVDSNNFISTFILGHLWIEYLLVQIVKISNPKLGGFAESLNHLKLIELVYGLELISDSHLETFKLINSMRNKLAHNIAYEPSVSEFSNLVTTAQKSFDDLTDGFEQTLAELEGKNSISECNEFVYPEIFMQIAYELEAIYREHGGEWGSFKN